MATTNSNQRHRVIFAGICSLVLTVGLARFAYTPLLPLMRAQAGLSHLAGGWLATINYMGYITGAILAASLSDLRQKFVLYRLGLIVGVLSTAAMGLTDNVVLWAGLRYVAGFSSTAGLLLASGLVLNWLMRNGMRAELGLHFAGLGLGIAVSGVTIAAMSHGLAWDQQWIGLGGLCFVLFWPAWFWLPAPVIAHSAVAATLDDAATPTRHWMALLILAYFCAGFGFAIGATYTVAIVVKLPALADVGSWVWVVVGIAATPSTFIWDRVAGAVGAVRALMIAYGLQTASLIIPAASDSAMLNVIGAMLFGVTFVGIVSLTLSLVGRRFPHNPAKAMARMTIGYGVAQIIAPAMTGYIADATDSYRGALIVTAIVMLAGMVVLQLLVVEERKAPTTGRA